MSFSAVQLSNCHQILCKQRKHKKAFKNGEKSNSKDVVDQPQLRAKHSCSLTLTSFWLGPE